MAVVTGKAFFWAPHITTSSSNGLIMETLPLQGRASVDWFCLVWDILYFSNRSILDIQEASYGIKAYSR